MTQPVFQVRDERWNALGIDLPTFGIEAVRGITEKLDLTTIGEICFVFSNDDQVQTLNKTYRHQDKPTNVLSFPVSPSAQDHTDAPLGDVVFAIETILNESKSAEKPIEHHLCHLIVHGVLHLLGYDHENEPDALAMEELERNILLHLGVPDPYNSDFEDR